MDGTVKKVVEELVSERYGGRRWEQVRVRAGLDAEVVGERTPCDPVRLLGVAGEVLAIPRLAMLEAFGRHWVLNSVKKSGVEHPGWEGRSLSGFIDEIPAFLEKLSPLEEGVKKTQFRIGERSSSGFRLEFETDEPEWTPVVVGMLLGVGELFKTSLQVERVEEKEKERGDGKGTERFWVKWTELRRP